MARRQRVKVGHAAIRLRRSGGVFGVEALVRQRRHRISTTNIRKALEKAAEALGVRAGRRMTLVLCGDRFMRDLNARYRRIARPTDVLAFAAHIDDQLGDVVISVETAARQARERSHPLKDELAILAIHGLLHLLGYDHETDDGRMRRLESVLHRRLGLCERKRIETK